MEKFSTEFFAFLQEELKRNGAIHATNSPNPALQGYETTNNHIDFWKNLEKLFHHNFWNYQKQCQKERD